jgi:peptidyl-prolyl cis-trans isomerase C
MRQGKNFLLTVALMFLLAGCEYLPWNKPAKPSEPPVPPKGTVVAKVGNFYVMADDLNKEVEAFNSFVTAQGMEVNKLDTRDKKIAYLRNDVVRKYILYQEALDRGLDKREDIARAIENARIGILVSELDRQEREKISVSSQEVEEFYNQNKELLKEPEQRKIREIMLPTEDEAKQVYIELLKGADFAATAQQYSKAHSAAKGGDLGFMVVDPDPAKRAKFDKFYEIAFSPSLEAGGISTFFKGPDGYYILKVEEIKKGEAKSLNELWERIKNWLTYEKQQRAVADLATKLSGETKIEIYEGKVE